MSLSLLIHDTVAFTRSKRRSSVLTYPKHLDAPPPIPPSLVNSPYLSAPNSVFRRRATLHRWPSQEEDEWLRDMVPMDRSSPSEASTPSPTSSDCPFTFMLTPSSSVLRPRSTGPDASTPARRALCGPGAAHPHS